MRVALVVVVVVGCGDSGSSADAPGHTIGITIEGTTTAVFPERGSLKATVHVDNGDSLDVTTETAWTSDMPAVATITSGTGLITTVDAGTTEIHASYDGFDAMVTYTVIMPTLAVANGGAITMFPANATGNHAPLRAIIGAATTFVAPSGIAIAGHELVVADGAAKAIDVFAYDADGNVAPLRRITGVATTLGNPIHVAVTATEIFVTDLATIKVFPLAGSGNIAPTRTIGGAGTTLGTTSGIDLTATQIYVTSDTNAVLVFAIGDNGNPPPTSQIAGGATNLSTPRGLLLIPNTSPPYLVVTNGGTNSITTFDSGVAGNTPPLATDVGVVTGLSNPDGLAVLDTSIYVANFTTSQVLVFGLQPGPNSPPLATIAGAATTLSSPRDVAIFVYP